MAIDTIKSTAVLDGTIATADIADDAVTSAKLDTNIAVAGDLTVDTNTLKVDATNNRVGIGTATPSVELDIQTTTSGTKFQIQNTGSGGQNVDIIDDIAQSRIRHVGTRLELGADHNNLGTSDPRVRFRVGNTPQASITGHGGIAFGFGSDTAAANTLDDYEEGTWTPIIHSAGGTPTTYSFGVNGNYGYYTKVGNIVTAHAHCVFQRGTATGAIDLGGLPFTSANVTTGYASTTTSYWSLATAIVKVEMHLNPNSTRGSNTTRIATGATTSMNTSLQSGNLNTGSNTILYSITYRSA